MTDNTHLQSLAEIVFRSIVAEGRIQEAEASDFITSLVRQWISYEGNATWFFGEEQIYFIHRPTPLGNPLLTTERVQPGWFANLQQEWKVDPDEFPNIIEQLNRGQSAKTVNTEGVPLCLCVNLRERHVGVEKLVTPPGLPGGK